MENPTLAPFSACVSSGSCFPGGSWTRWPPLTGTQEVCQASLSLVQIPQNLFLIKVASESQRKVKA